MQLSCCGCSASAVGRQGGAVSRPNKATHFWVALFGSEQAPRDGRRAFRLQYEGKFCRTHAVAAVPAASAGVGSFHGSRPRFSLQAKGGRPGGRLIGFPPLSQGVLQVRVALATIRVAIMCRVLSCPGVAVETRARSANHYAAWPDRKSAGGLRGPGGV